MDSTCSIGECNRPVVGWGMCSGHYQRWQKHGDGFDRSPLRGFGRKGCRVDGCDRPHKGHGLCRAHLVRQRERGDVGTTEVRAWREGLADTAKRLLAKAVEDEHGCLVLAPTEPNGRVRIKRGKKTWLAHRLILVWKTGMNPTDLDSIHKCERGHMGCINPDHLKFGTRSENRYRFFAARRGQPWPL